MTKARPVSLSDAHEVRDRCLCFSAQRAARSLGRRFDGIFRDLGLTNGQFSLMMALSAGKRWRYRDLAGFLAMDRTTLTAALKSLERRGLVILTDDEKDKRSRQVALTHAGSRLVAAAFPLWCEEHARLERELGAKNTQVVLQSLGRLAF